MPLSLQKKLPLVLLLVLLMLAAIGYLSYQSSGSLKESIGWEKHTHEVLLKLDDTLISMLNVETGTRGFVVTGNESFLEPYNTGRVNSVKDLEDLQSLINDNKQQIETLAVLREQVNEKISISQTHIESRRADGLLNAVNEVSKGEGYTSMGNIRLAIDKMKDEELRLLKVREANLQNTLNSNFWLMFTASFAGVIGLGIANFIVLFEMKKRQTAENDLVKANRDLEKRVTERTEDLKLANENLHESEDFKRSVIDSLSAHIAVLDKNGEIILVNNAWENFAEGNAGIEKVGQTGIGQNYLSVCEQATTDSDMQSVAESLRAILSGEKQNFTIEYPCHSPTEECWFLMQANALQDAEGGVVVSQYNITDRVKAEQSVRLNEEFNRAIIESNPDCFKVLDLEGNFLSMNTQGLCLMEIDDFEPFIGKQWVENWEGIENSHAKGAIAKALAGENSNFEGFCKTAKGTAKWWEVSVAPVFGEQREVHRIISVSRDITERKNVEIERERLLVNEKKARQEAEIANRLRDEFMATVSHELRTPLNAILGWAKILKTGKIDAEKSAKAVDTIIKNAETQNRLIQDLMEAARLISGKLVLEREAINAEDLVVSAVETIKPTADAKNISVNQSIAENARDTNISGDRNRLNQVLSNLLTNAVKFTPENGTIDVSLIAERKSVVIKIKDSGAGINSEFLPYVFERFRQDSANIKQSGGLGLGLAIVRQLTELHGGEVSVESEGENKGSTFTVKLPINNKE